MKREKRNYSSLTPRSLKLPSSFLNRLPQTNFSLKRTDKNSAAAPPAEPLPKWSRVLLKLDAERQDSSFISVRQVNLTLKGEPVLWLDEWLNRGLCQDVADAILSAFRVFHERTIEQDLREQQLKTLKRAYAQSGRTNMKHKFYFPSETDPHPIKCGHLRALFGTSSVNLYTNAFGRGFTMSSCSSGGSQNWSTHLPHLRTNTVPTNLRSHNATSASLTPSPSVLVFSPLRDRCNDKVSQGFYYGPTGMT